MSGFEAVVITVWLIIIGCLLGVYMDLQQSKVYACSEVVKTDPVAVKQLCKRARRYGD